MTDQTRVWFSSDLHLGHANIIAYCDRPFASVQEMNETLVHNFNSLVEPEDEVYLLGDLCMGNRKKSSEYLFQLNGKLHWVKGNHDQGLLKIPEVVERFEWIKDYHEMRVKLESGKKIPVVLFHFPILSWHRKHHGAVCLHGHVHSADRLATAKLLSQLNSGKEMPRIFDVGVDANDYHPVMLDELLNTHHKLNQGS